MPLPDYAPALAAEIGRGLYDERDICGQFSIPVTALRALLAMPEFQALCISEHTAYHGAGNIQQRIQDKATIALERSIHLLYQGVADEKTPVTLRQTFLQKLQELAGLDAVTRKAQAAEGALLAGGAGAGRPMLSININLPGKTVQVQAAAAPASVLEGEAVQISDQVPTDLPGEDA